MFSVEHVALALEDAVGLLFRGLLVLTTDSTVSLSTLRTFQVQVPIDFGSRGAD